LVEVYGARLLAVVYYAGSWMWIQMVHNLYSSLNQHKRENKLLITS